MMSKITPMISLSNIMWSYIIMRLSFRMIKVSWRNRCRYVSEHVSLKHQQHSSSKLRPWDASCGCEEWRPVETALFPAAPQFYIWPALQLSIFIASGNPREARNSHRNRVDDLECARSVCFACLCLHQVQHSSELQNCT